MAKGNNALLLIVAAGVVIWLVSASGNADASTMLPPGTDALLQFPGLGASYVISGDSQARINALVNEMIARGYSLLQIELMLSQILFETGMLTSDANIHLMNQNNYAGLTTTGGDYAAYNSISDFMDAYAGFLTKGANPLGATSLTDFNNRLIANHYYTENPAVYLNGLQGYFNALTQ